MLQPQNDLRNQRSFTTSLKRLAMVMAFSIICASVSAEPRLSNPIEALIAGKAPETVADLKAIEARVKEISRNVLPYTVAIRVGPAHGSGVIISEDGYVLTAGHVAGKPNRRVVFTLANGREVPGRTLGINSGLDAGLMKITEDGKWPHIEMVRAPIVRPGQWCLATGHPEGYQEGRPPVVRLGRVVGMQRTLIRTDCTLTGGDSGGPLFDLNGKLIGIHSRIGEALEVNMHVPLNFYREHWDRLAAGEMWGVLPGHGSYIGVFRDRSAERARVLGVAEHSPAERAGILAGDVITRFDDVEVRDFDTLVQAVRQRDPGMRVKVEVLREERTVKLEMVIGRREG